MTPHPPYSPASPALHPLPLALRYVAFAIVATLGNLAAQRFVIDFAFAPETGLATTTGPSQQTFLLALLVGTAVGLVIKYVLDKRWIFADASRGIRGHGRKFSLYTLMGIATTAIFWGSETLFWLVWQEHSAREAGAVLGLAIGYFVKYRLDRRFVFTNSGQQAVPGQAVQSRSPGA